MDNDWRTDRLAGSYLTKDVKTMYCPKCGNDSSTEQRYCRSCGFGLQTVSQLLVDEHPPVKSENSSVENVQPQPRGWRNPLLYGFFMLLLGTIIIYFGKRMLAEKSVADIGTILALLGVVLISLKGIFLVLPRSSSLPQTKAPAESESATKTAARVTI